MRKAREAEAPSADRHCNGWPFRQFLKIAHVPAHAHALHRGRAVRGLRNPAVSAPARPPAICTTTNAKTPAGAMPANVSLNDRAIVTAGLANEVEAVNQ